MQLKEYQEFTKSTSMYTENAGPLVGLMCLVLGLNGEAGEVAEKFKKVIRRGRNTFTREEKLEIKKEIGDVLWYAVQMCNELDFDIEDVIKLNVEKLESRKARDLLHSEGDNR